MHDRVRFAMPLSRRLSLLRVRPLAGNKACGWLTAGPFRVPCALGPAGIVRLKREGDGGTPGGRFRLLWGYYRPDRLRPGAAGVPLKPMRPDQGWCEDPASPRYNRPVRLPAADCTDRMWRDDRLYDLVFVLDQNFIRRAKGCGSAIFFHLARPGLAPTAGCVAIRPADMAKLAPRLARGAVIAIGLGSLQGCGRKGTKARRGAKPAATPWESRRSASLRGRSSLRANRRAGARSPA